MEISAGRGKLYRANSVELVAAISYQLNEKPATEPTGWWGECILTDSVGIRDNGRYIIELEDGRKGRCYLKKRVNRVVRGIPPRYLYHFTGTGPLE
ncbi:hypothetical protein ACFLYR_01270 [Chloroflexota bacterium]